MTIAVLTRRLMDLGASAEIIALAVEAVTLASRDGHAPSRSITRDKEREQARIRQQNRRDRIAALRQLMEAQANDGATASVIVTRDDRDASRDGAPKHCDLSSTSSSVKVVTEEGSKKKVRSENTRARGTRLDLTTVLSPPDRAAAIDLGADPARVDGMWAEFIDYWIGVPGQRGTKLDWSATWRNRVRMIATKGHQKNGQRTVSNAFDDLIARSESGGGEDCDEPADDIRVVSPQGR